MSSSIQCLNLTLKIEGLVIGLHHPIQPYLRPRPQLRKVWVLTHSMIISTSVPLSIWVLKPGLLSSLSWPSVWATFQELLYEASPQCPKPQRFHLSLEFTLPLVCILSLSTKVLFLVQSAARTVYVLCLTLPTLSLALGQAWRRFGTLWVCAFITLFLLISRFCLFPYRFPL